MITIPGNWAKVFSALKQLFFAVLLLLPGLLMPAERAKNIPGIDPLPLATGDNRPTNSQNSSDPSSTTTNPQLNPADPGFPKIRNLTVVPEPSEAYTAKISWDIYPDASTPVYVVRFSKPISNRAILLEAYNLTSPPLAAGTQVFLNRDMPEGVYYYAVVTAFELSRDGRLELKPGQNYTVVPFMVYRQDGTKPSDTARPSIAHADRDPNLKPGDFYIRSLSALDTEKGIVLNWPGLPLRGIEYEIFRSLEPIDSAERIDRAVRLGNVREDSPFFADEDAIVGKRMYYGVSVRDQVTGKVYRDLKYQTSYIEHTHRRPERELRYDTFLPDSLTAFLASRDTIQLIWIDPGPTVREYRVYRNNMPISSAEILANSKELGTASPGSSGFRDSGLEPGTYYYALLPITTSGELLSVFQPGRTLTMFGVTLRGSSVTDPSNQDNRSDTSKNEVSNSRSAISGFEIALQGRDVKLAWSLIPDAPETRIQVFRAREALDDPTALKEKAFLVADVAAKDGVAIDNAPGAGNHYYSIAEYDPATKTYIAVYFSRKPLTIDGSGNNESISGEDATARLERILSGTFSSAQFAETDEQLTLYLGETGLPAALRSKARFYLGIVKFRLKKYAEARQIFESEEAQAHDRERALFWYRISLERMNR